MKRVVAERLSEDDLAYRINHRTEVDVPTDMTVVGLPQVHESDQVHEDVAGFAMPTITNKWWGMERTFMNVSGLYTMKELTIEKNGHTSMHFHIDKHETLYVASGTLTLEVQFNKEIRLYKLSAGQAWVVPPGYPHRLIAADDRVVIIEASSYDTPSDSIRLY